MPDLRQRFRSRRQQPGVPGCLAERFGIETTEHWIADVLAGFVRAAADPVVLAQVLAEIVPFARDVIEHRTTLPATA